MLVRLVPEQVSDSWEVFAPMIENSLAPTGIVTEETMVNILSSILLDELVCWIWMSNGAAKAFITTVITIDPVTHVSSLLIYSIHADGLSHEDFKNGIDKLKDYAASLDCKFLSAYTYLPSVSGIVKETNGNSSLTYVNWRL